MQGAWHISHLGHAVVHFSNPFTELSYIRQYVRVLLVLAKADPLYASITRLLGNDRVGDFYVDWRGRIIESNDQALSLLPRGERLLD